MLHAWGCLSRFLTFWFEHVELEALIIPDKHTNSQNPNGRGWLSFVMIRKKEICFDVRNFTYGDSESPTAD